MQSREVIDRAAEPQKSGGRGTELPAIPNRSISLGSGVTVAYPQPALSLNADNSDEIIYVIQGGHVASGTWGWMTGYDGSGAKSAGRPSENAEMVGAG